MNSQAIDVLMSIIIFFGSYMNANAHNMLVIMLGPHFKNIKIIQDQVHNIVATNIVVKFDVKGVYLLLLQV